MSLKTWCHVFKWLFTLCLITYPIYIVWSWSTLTVAQSTHPNLFLHFQNNAIPFNLFQQLSGILVDFSYGIFWMLCLWYLNRLFKLYEQDHYFEPQNILLIQRVGLFFLIEELIRLCAMPLHTFLFTFHQPVGKHLIAFSFSQDNFYSIIIAATILIIGAIMRQAQILQTEQALTI